MGESHNAGGGALLDFVTGAPVSGAPEPAWNHGARRRRTTADPPIQIHIHDEHTYVMRQSKAVHYEAPFMFLLFGNERALLLDTGATADQGRFPLRAAVDLLVATWLRRHPRETYELVVAHTHGHGDHHAADVQFAGREHTTVVPLAVDAVRDYFGFRDWPSDAVHFDLGGRVLDVVGCPGHHEASICVYDPWSGFLLTGDTVYPGRLYVFDHAEFVASMDRLVRFAAQRRVTGVYGCHIEMTRTPGRDYPTGCTYQPDEPPLRMDVERLAAVRDAALAARTRGAYAHDDFIIWHGVTPGLLAKNAVRLLRDRISNTLARER
jgi:glyoxylase-like metal-dependent hydrolase (beta-lactamase superfamily II)